MLFVIANINNHYKSCTLEPGKDNQNNTYYFLQRGGEMGELTRRFNWHQTSLGTFACRPKSLRAKKLAQNLHGDIYAGASTESVAVFNIMLPAKQTKL